MNAIPVSSRPHYASPETRETPEEGDLPVVTQEQLERAAAFTRLLKNPDFMLALSYLQDGALAGLTNAGEDRDLRVAQGAFRFSAKIIPDLQSDIDLTNRAQEERARAIKAAQEKTPPAQGD